MASRALKILAGGFAIAGTTLGIVFLIVSLRPKAKAPPKLPSVKAAELSPGRYVTVDTDSLRYFVVTPLHGDLRVVAAPIDMGTVLMPDIHWWKPFANCQEFRLDAAQGAVTSESRFQCHDTNHPEARLKQWQWDIDGKHIVDPENTKTDNMYRVRFERLADDVIFRGLEPN
jgi:hypothetical protein